MNKYEKLLEDAYTKWGHNSQRLIWIEEMAELIQKLAKSDRKVNPSFLSEIEEELTDVIICVDQMKQIYPGYTKFMVQKVSRLERLVYVLEEYLPEELKQQ